MSSLFEHSGESIVAYCDGGSRGNPGPAGFGVYIQDSAGKVLAELSEFVGTRTNNFAEYSALLASLEFAIANGHRSLRVVSDSELMVKQIKGQYRVNSPELRPLYEEAKRRITRLDQFQIQHVCGRKTAMQTGWPTWLWTAEWAGLRRPPRRPLQPNWHRRPARASCSAD
jgi:ribonuclease HI